MNNKDFKWTEKRFGLTFANILKKLGGLSKNNTDGSLEYKDEQGNVSKLVTDSTFSSLLAKNGLIEVKWQELKDKRDNGKLIPGSLYRITDYNCTTTQQNTQSAGHQFDIVLLALSDNKLAEEGWAMMHDNIYDVTDEAGVTKKCYLYKPSSYNEYNIVIVDTLLGAYELGGEFIEINEETKTAFINTQGAGMEVPYTFDNFVTSENVPYNYFQNSNLSAWKVWYCLDNDTARFAWADDRDSYGIICPGNIDGEPKGIYIRDVENDVGSSTRLYAWYNKEEDAYCYTFSPNPKIGDSTTDIDGDGGSGAGKITGFVGIGRGVIYRLIDEWNNDVAYDFKNIQFLRPLTDGMYDEDEGTNTWVYTFNGYDLAAEEILDASIHTGELLYEDDTLKHAVYNNVISSFIPQDYNSNYVLPYVCVLDVIDKDSDKHLRIRNSTIKDCRHITVEGFITNVTIMSSGNCCIELNAGETTIIGSWTTRTYNQNGIYIGSKKVVLENI